MQVFSLTCNNLAWQLLNFCNNYENFHPFQITFYKNQASFQQYLLNHSLPQWRL